MKKFAAAIALLLTLAACGGKTVYVVETLPNDVTTTTEKSSPTTTKPRPTTTVSSYIPPSNNNYYTSFENQFLNDVDDLYDNYIYITDNDLLDMAYTICNALDTGVSLEAVIAVINNGMASYATQDTYNFVSAIMVSAIYNICPDHTWQITNI